MTSRGSAQQEICQWLALTQVSAPRRRVYFHAWEQDGQLPSGKAPAEWMHSSLAWLAASADHHCLAYSDPGYPPLLRTIACPPPVLFVVGDPGLLSARMVALVGARRASAGGIETARRFGQELAACEIAVISGLALGIDGAAHAGVLDAGGRTLAVMGCGLDQIYPRAHAALAKSIAVSGALVSEFTPGTSPLPGNFPRRNRLISGMSVATIVVEAGLRSGSLGTARLALEQGREVGAVPGAIQNRMAAGTNRLLRDGAALISCCEDILALMPQGLPPGAMPASESAGGHDRQDPADPVWQALEMFPLTIDSLAARTGWDIAPLGARLAELELAGSVRREPGGYSRTCSKPAETLVSPALCE